MPSAAGLSTNLLGPKTRELISLAVAITVRCDGCIAVRAESVARHRASREEIAKHSGSRRSQCRCGARLFHPRAGHLRAGDVAAASLIFRSRATNDDSRTDTFRQPAEYETPHSAFTPHFRRRGDVDSELPRRS